MALPYKDISTGKKEQVALMFDNIAVKYDFLNHLLSLGIDKRWRKKAVKKLAYQGPKNIIDIATGTGDFAVALQKLQPERVTGVDISAGMLEIGKNKIKDKGLEQKIQLHQGDAENLQFETHSFDAATAGFGVRNFENLEAGLAEIYRVLKHGGEIAILEFSQPERFPFKHIYNCYFQHVLPLIGKRFSKDNSAYAYLPESVQEFPYGEDFLKIMSNCGFSDLKQYKLSFGVASLYMGKKV